MLNNLKLTNFKRHRDLSIDFTDGINATRGSNEAGKSSTLHAIGYALFGTKALPHSLDDTVTWGEETKTLKVELSLTIDGQLYTFKRGKSGAEVIKNGTVFITGQNEVTAFAAQLLGADGTASTKLMFASQNGLRGALEEGPKALSQMIEDLAGFDTFDLILGNATDKLALGSSAMLEDRLKSAQTTLESAKATLPPKPDEEAHAAAVAKLEADLQDTKASITSLSEAAAAAEQTWRDVSASFMKRVELQTAVEKAEERVRVAISTVAGHEANAAKTMPNIAGLQAERDEALDWQNRAQAFATLQKLPATKHLEMTREEFEATLAKTTASVTDSRATLRSVENEIAATKARRINHDKCDKCGQDITHLETVSRVNAEVDAALITLEAKRSDAEAALNTDLDKLAELDSYRKIDFSRTTVIAKLAGYVSLNTGFFPPVVNWEGSEPGEVGPSFIAAEAALNEAKAEAQAIEQARVRLEMATGQLQNANSELAKLRAELKDSTLATSDDVLTATATKDAAVQAKLVADGKVILTRQSLSALREEFKSATSIWATANARVEDAERIIAQSQGDLETLGFNNALVKKLRAIRPAVADKLWNTVLASVSVMFSQMRGLESWVTKDKDGFKVNGQAVESLSGSTLDILGLAIRCALLKTFLPQCSLLILDEPAHGCDAERTEALVGFIAGAGFQQTILVTHEEISESMANNIIQL